jgi:hypothetical protein
MTEPPAAGLPRPGSATNLLLCGLAWAVSLIHVRAALDHFDEYVPYALSFVGLAALQLIWGIAALRRPSRRLWAIGAAGNLAVVVIWALSRTSGLPIGPDARAAETVGLLDLIATLDEVMLVALLIAGLFPRLVVSDGWLGGPRAQTAARAIALLMIFGTSLVLGGGVHAH